MKKIISWNVASIRARLDLVLQLLKDENPDVVFLQEIKTQEADFPYLAFTQAGYHAVISGQKAWNGVAILSKEPIDLEYTALKGFEDQARFVQARTSEGVHLISVYVPNGQAPMVDPTDTSRLEYKLKWIAALKEHLSQMHNYIVGGDFNVIRENRDVYDPIAFAGSPLMVPSVRAAFEDLLTLPVENPMRDLYPNDVIYTFWDFRGADLARNRGIFLDYFFADKKHYQDRIKMAGVLKDYRKMPKTSDHAPIFIELD